MSQSCPLSAGKQFRVALSDEKPLQIMGTVNAYCALMAERVGYRAIYISGGACANMSYGLPDLGITSLENVVADAERITSACSVPLMVDIDTGWGNYFSIERTIQQMIKAGVAAVHMEDQVAAKRCGHRPGKQLVETAEMVDRITAATHAKTDPDFFLIARTDAAADEGLDAAIQRANAYVNAGADGIFAEALTELSQFKAFVDAVDVPVLANITEFGKTPLFTVDELASVGVAMVLYPLTAVRAMNAAAQHVYETVRREGTQQSCVNQMQDRDTLYDLLHYYDYEKKLDKLER